MKKICYVASPVRSVLEIEDYSPAGYERVIALALQGCKEVKKRGYIPLSSVLLFMNIYSERIEREEALFDGLALLTRCDCFYEVKSAYISEGIVEEREFAQKLGLKIL